MHGLNETERRFVGRAVRRKRVFLALSLCGIVVAALYGGWAVRRHFRDPRSPSGTRAVVVVLVLLNARQNLRQYRYAVALEKLGRADGPAV